MTQLARNALLDPLAQATTAHPGLLLQRGWARFVRTNADNAGEDGKTKHLQRICGTKAPPEYRRAFDRWFEATRDRRGGFLQAVMAVQGRLLIGLNGGGALETGCATQHTHGMPYLPGSSVKGVVRAWAQRWPEQPQGWDAQVQTLFGHEDASGAGLLVFHDAWWVPGSAPGEPDMPFVEEVVTPHHAGYYGSEGKEPATDLDSPVPNGMVGVRGSFLFVMEGDPRLLDLGGGLLGQALAEDGLGTKTRAGYGSFRLDADALKRLTAEAERRAAERRPARGLLRYQPAQGTVTVTVGNLTTAPLQVAEALTLATDLTREMLTGRRARDGTLAVGARVRTEGNRTTLVGLQAWTTTP